ncbi:glycosyltransferase [Halomonas almeriensis]|uniref:glycosyltransferase n=1 Tax=Halomonas almeriensis TaxID=308163 RepID=UPI0025B424FE|nr:glycosyltransferase [Halomonas almeriensis]MDN3552481.1 glycosyltransferase [Halomonas almeriensis]
MRTLIVVRTLKVGGMERVAVNLADAFAEEGHDSHLMYFKARSPQLAPRDVRVRVHHFPLSRAVWTSGLGGPLEVLARLANSLVRKSYSLMAGWWAGRLFARELARLEDEHGRFDRIIFRGMGTFEAVWSFHDARACYVLESVLGLSRQQDRLAHRKARALFDDKHLVCVSSGVAAQVGESLSRLGATPASLRTITNPCPIDEIRSAATEASAASHYPPYLLNVARLVPPKNQRRLLEAYALMHTPIPLVIVGEGRLRVELEALAASLQIAERVHFVGNQLNPYPWMQQARLFVLSSDHEGLGIVLLEALACGTPVVSVDCPGGVRDIMQGELAEHLCAMTPEALAECLDRTLAADGYAIDDAWLNAFAPTRIASQFLQEPADS